MKKILLISTTALVILGAGCARPAKPPSQPVTPPAAANTQLPEKPNLKQTGWQYFVSKTDNGLYAQREKEPSILLTKIDVPQLAPSRSDLSGCDASNSVNENSNIILIQCAKTPEEGEGPVEITSYFLNKDAMTFVRPETLPEDVIAATSENTRFSSDGNYLARFGFKNVGNDTKEYVAIFDLTTLKDVVTYEVPDGFTFLKNPESWATLSVDQPSSWTDVGVFSLQLYKAPPTAGNRKPVRTEKLMVVQPQNLSQGSAPAGTEFPGTWKNPVYGFSFSLSLGVGAQVDKSGGATFFDPATKTEYANIIIQPGIPQVPLPANKIENIILDGSAAKIYHDTDAKTGTKKIDKLWVQMPNSQNIILVQSPVAEQENFDFKTMIKTWKWNLKK